MSSPGKNDDEKKNTKGAKDTNDKKGKKDKAAGGNKNRVGKNKPSK
jgi:hypothetical protein